MSDLIAEYKAMLMNADSLDIVYLSAESTDLYPSDGAELVSLTGVNSVGDVVLNLRFDTSTEWTGAEYHGIKKEDITGLPHATDVLAELKHFLTDDSNDRYCWSYWFIQFFNELIDEKPKVNSVKDLAFSLGADEYSTLKGTAYNLNVEADYDTSKEKLGFLVMEKVLKLAPIADEIRQLRNRLSALENNYRIIHENIKPALMLHGMVGMARTEIKPAINVDDVDDEKPKPEITPAFNVDDEDIPF